MTVRSVSVRVPRAAVEGPAVCRRVFLCHHSPHLSGKGAALGQESGVVLWEVADPYDVRIVCSSASIRAFERALRAGPDQPQAHRAMVKEPCSTVPVRWRGSAGCRPRRWRQARVHGTGRDGGPGRSLAERVGTAVFPGVEGDGGASARTAGRCRARRGGGGGADGRAAVRLFEPGRGGGRPAGRSRGRRERPRRGAGVPPTPVGGGQLPGRHLDADGQRRDLGHRHRHRRLRLRAAAGRG